MDHADRGLRLEVRAMLGRLDYELCALRRMVITPEDAKRERERRAWIRRLTRDRDGLVEAVAWWERTA